MAQLRRGVVISGGKVGERSVGWAAGRTVTRQELKHLIRVCAQITDQYEFVVAGSQSILGQVPNPPPEFAVSIEVDINSTGGARAAEKIEGAIGEGSMF